LYTSNVLKLHFFGCKQEYLRQHSAHRINDYHSLSQYFCIEWWIGRFTVHRSRNSSFGDQRPRRRLCIGFGM